MNWEWSDLYSHPLWMVSSVILALVVRAQRKSLWNPRACLVRLKGKTAIVTGANTEIADLLGFSRTTISKVYREWSEKEKISSERQFCGRNCLVDAGIGIGKFIALDFARRGARVILACRSEARGTAALKEIRESTGNHDVHLRLLDTSSMESVRKFAAQILKEEKELHILVNNAGASGLPIQITADGLEITFATNHVGPFLLTSLLLDLLKKSAPARIVNVASAMHWKGDVDFAHFHGEKLNHGVNRVYNHTKLHNVIWTNELARRLQGTGVTANSLHPGVVMTEVMRNYSFILRLLFNLIGFFFFKTAEEGAFSPIYCAVAEENEGITGKYFDSDCSLVLPAPPARDPALGVKEYEFCERLIAKL